MNNWDLIERAKAADTDAFAEFYRRYYGAVLALLLSRTRGLGTNTLPLAEDLTQETFFRVLRRIDSFNDVGKDPMALLTRIACRLYADHRKSIRFRMEVMSSDGGYLEDDVANHAGQFIHHDGLVPSAEETYLRHETAGEVRAGLARLVPRQRECIWMRFYEDRNVDETAAELGTNSNVVRGLQHRATRRLAKFVRAA